MSSWLLLVCCVWHSFTASNYLYYLLFISLFNYYVVAITSWWIKDYHYRSIFIRLAVVASQSREITRNSDKIWPYSSSRSFKVIDLVINRKPMYDFLLVTNSNFAVSATVFEILTLKSRKSLNFLTPHFFEAPFGEPLRIWWWNLASEN